MPDLNRFTPPPGWEGRKPDEPFHATIPPGRLERVRWCVLQAIELALRDDTVGGADTDAPAYDLTLVFTRAADQQQRPAQHSGCSSPRWTPCWRASGPPRVAEPVLEEFHGPVVTRLYPRQTERVVVARLAAGLTCEPVGAWQARVWLIPAETPLPSVGVLPLPRKRA